MGALAILEPFWPYIWRALAIAALVAAGWWAWDHFVANPYIAKGVAQEHLNTVKAETRATAAEGANASLQADVNTLRSRVQTANAAADAITKQELAFAAANKALRAQLAVKDAALETERQHFAAIASGPPAPTREEACNEADRISADYAARRLR